MKFCGCIRRIKKQALSPICTSKFEPIASRCPGQERIRWATVPTYKYNFFTLNLSNPRCWIGSEEVETTLPDAKNCISVHTGTHRIVQPDTFWFWICSRATWNGVLVGSPTNHVQMRSVSHIDNYQRASCGTILSSFWLDNWKWANSFIGDILGDILWDFWS